MRALVLALPVFAVGCNVVFGFDVINPDVDASTDGQADARFANQPLRVIATPGPHRYDTSYKYVYAAPVTVEIGATDPTTMIYYTTDGSTPTMSSAHGTAPVPVVIDAGPTPLSYFGKTATDTSQVMMPDVYHYDPVATASEGYVVTNTQLQGGTPIAIVGPGEQVTMATAHVQIWNYTGCGNCTVQLVYGIGTTDQGCLYDTARDSPTMGPGEFPGAMHDATFTVSAPTAPGVYDVIVANILQVDCNAAMAAGTLATRPDKTRIGIVVVAQ